MATATLSRPQVQTENWTGVFPTENCTETQSALFVKKLLAVSLSNIAYLRAIFPEHAFGDRCLEDMQLKILKDDSKCQGACQVVKWIRGCFDALDKKFLRQAILGIFVDASNENSLIESYTYRFTYKDETIMSVYRNDTELIASSESKKCTVMLLRTLIILMQSLRPLPDDVMITMKLYYYDDVTPADYEPPGFKSCAAGNFIYDVDTINLTLGDVNTKYHAVNLRMKTANNQFEGKDNDQEAEHKQQDREDQKMEMISSPSQDFFETREDNADQMKMESETAVDSTCPTQPVSNVAKENIADDFGVKCPCGSSTDDGLMVLCEECKTWQHAICFKLLDENAIPEKHVCSVCATNNSHLAATDPHLNMLPRSTAEGVCLWRRAIWLCKSSRRLTALSIASCLDVDKAKAAMIFARLDKEGYLRPSTGSQSKLNRLVDNDRIVSDGVTKYLMSSGIIIRSQESETATPDIDIPSQGTAIRATQVDAVTEQTKMLKVTPPPIKSAFKIKKSDSQGVKRAISSINKEHQFDVVDDYSQESRDSRRRGTKRLKTSIVHNALMV